MAKIFISYAKEDKTTAEKIYDSLESEGHSVWMDSKNLLPGQKRKTEIEKRIEESDIFIACLSNNYVDKPGDIQKELKNALDFADRKPEGRIYIIPILLDNCTIPSVLKGIQPANYSTLDDRKNLLNAINLYSSDENLETTKKKTTSQKQESVEAKYPNFIKQNIESIVSNSALLAEKIYPRIVTKKMEAQLRDIDDRLGHVDYHDPFNNAEYARQRIDEFNSVTGLEFSPYEINLVDFFLIHPEQMPVWLVFEQVYKDGSQKEWQTYRFYFENVYLERWAKKDENQVKQMGDWILEKAKRIYEIVQRNFPNVKPKQYYVLIKF